MRKTLNLITVVILIQSSGSIAEEPGSSPFAATALVVVSDVDMQATAYNHGILNQLPGASDQLTIISFSKETISTKSIPVSNSVLSWPQVMAIDPNRDFVYVIETRGSFEPDVKRVENVNVNTPSGNQISSVSISDPLKPQLIEVTDIALNPTTVSLSPDGRTLVLSNGQDGKELLFVEVDRGRFGKQTRIAPNVKKPINGVRWHPSGDYLAINEGNTHIVFYEVSKQARQLKQIGDKVPAGDWISSGRFTKDGAYFLVPDVKWGTEPTSYVMNPRGSLVAIKFEQEGSHRITSTATVGFGPEGFAMNPAETLLVSVNINRTYLPLSGVPLEPWEGANHSSLTTVAFDKQTGKLSTLDHYNFEGLLPESATFDTTGQSLAVTVFHHREDPQQKGYVKFWEVNEGIRPTLSPTGLEIAVARGAHQIELVK